MLDMEIWNDINEYEGWYQVSNLGRVKSLGRVFTRKNGAQFTVTEKFITPSIMTSGYPYVGLRKAGPKKNHSIHRLLANAFIPNPENKPTVNHKDGVKTNNHIDNLEWATYPENVNHAFSTGLNKNRGEGHKLSIFTDDDIRTIKVLLSIGEKQEVIAKAFNTNQPAISQIKSGARWSHINP